MTALARPDRIDIGEVMNRTFSAIGANFVPFLLLSMILAALPNVLLTFGFTMWLPILAADTDLATYGLLTILFGLLAIVLLMIPSYILVGAITQGAIVHYNGGRASFGECFSTGLRFALPLLGLGIITALGMYGYFLLLIVPAFLALTRWAVAAPALVVERIGVFESFRRSIDLTRGNRWRVFLFGLIYVAISSLISGAISFVAASFGGGFGANPYYSADPFAVGDVSSTAFWIGQGALIVYASLNAMILSAGQAAVYYELRVLKEGATSDELAKVFE